MSARPCPSCKKQLPEATLRALPQGTTCPFCAAPLKWTPRRPLAGQSIDRNNGPVQASPPPPPAAPPPSTMKTPPPPSADEDGYAGFQVSDITPPPVAIPSLAPPIAAPLPLAAVEASGRTRRLMLMGSGAALSLAVGLVLVLRAPGGATAVASVATPVTQVAPTTEPLAPTTPEVAPAEAPPPAADSAKTGRVAKRRAGPAKRKASVAHHGKRQVKREVRVAKAERKQRTLAAKRTTAPSAPAERGDPRPPYERGNALLFAGDAAGAIAAYREAVNDAPTDPIGYRGLGLAYEQKGETASAIRALHKYLKLAPRAADRAIISRRIDRLSKNAGAK